MSKPTAYLGWVPGAEVAKITEPSSGKKLLGWISGEKPAFQFWNWHLWLIDQWIQYFDTSVTALQTHYDAVIGAGIGCTHATLEVALADVTLGANKRILIKDSLSISSTIHLTKAGWIITAVPGVTYTKSSIASCLSCEAANIEIRSMRFASFSTAGDKAITGTSAWQYGRVMFCNFLNCDTEVDDTSTVAGKKPAQIANITE